MIERRGYQRGAASANLEEFDRLFVERVHALVKFGYDRLEPQRYATAQETEITGDLVSGIEAVLEEATEGWMPFFSVHDDPPINTRRRKGRPVAVGRGRARKRVDILLNSSETSPYTRFHFESKRLGKGNAVGKFLGTAGLGCFLTGAYAIEESRVGMLGYIQDGTEESWAAKLEKQIVADALELGVTQDGAWRCRPVIPQLPHTYLTCHKRGKELGQVMVFHSLLRFC